MLVGIIAGSMVLSALLKLLLEQSSYGLLVAATTTTALLMLHYALYSPTLTIIVLNGYSGEVTLVRSNVEENILIVDSNGIGYVNQWTFDKTYTKPIVIRADGSTVDTMIAGFNSGSFWGRGKACCIDGKFIECT